MTHTFVAITNPDGSVAHVYSWGTDFNLHGWSTDQKYDIHAANLALSDGRAEKVGDKELDPFVTEAFGLLNQKQNDHWNGWVSYNCKTEAYKLVNVASGLRAATAAAAAQKGYDSIKVSTDGKSVTATYTPTGSHISRSITCTVGGCE